MISDLIAPLRWVFGVAAASLILVGCGSSDKSTTISVHEAFKVQAVVVGLYCIYGSASKAQYEGCLKHVTLEQVSKRNTNAAQYAIGTRTTCGYDAGPACRPRHQIVERIFGKP